MMYLTDRKVTEKIGAEGAINLVVKKLLLMLNYSFFNIFELLVTKNIVPNFFRKKLPA
jgi:hypothetical protein